MPDGSSFPSGHGIDPVRVEIIRLAMLAGLEYQVARQGAAKNLELSLGALDKAVAAERKQARSRTDAAQRTQPPPAPGEVRWPPGYQMTSRGLYGPPAGDDPPLWLSALFEVLGHARDEAGEGWGVSMRWHDLDGMQHDYALPAELTVADPGRLESELMRRGLRIATDPDARRMLRRTLGELRSGDRVRLSYATGWQGGSAVSAFLLPDGTMLGTAAETFVLHAKAADVRQRCAEAGTLDGWKAKVAALAMGNPLAAFCIAAAFAGPLLQPAGETGGGFHFFGPSKVGKTLAMQMGLSAWGLPVKAGGALRDWRSTANAMEAAGEECTDGLLPLDEIHQADPADVAAAAYMLADGAGKRRLNKDASAARRREWRTLMLSTGEYDLATAVARTGQKIPAGAEVRLPSISLQDAGAAWPTLHGRADLPALAADLHHAMKGQHGTAARAFIGHLARFRAERSDELERTIASTRDHFAGLVGATADPQVRDVARRCALVAAAGTLAGAWGVLPWTPGEAERAAEAMLRSWIARRPGGLGSAEAAAHLDRVRSVLVQHGAARFTLLVLHQRQWEEAEPTRLTQNRIGWRRHAADADEYLFPLETWRSEVCAPVGLDPTATARTLKDAGFLRVPPKGKDRSVKERIPGHANPMRLYAVSGAILGVAEGETGQ